MGINTYKYKFWLGDTPVEIKDSNLTFEEHLKAQLNKVYTKTNALRRIRRFTISVHVMILFFLIVSIVAQYLLE